MAIFSPNSVAAVTTYTVYNPDSGSYDLFAQRLDASGQAIGSSIRVSDPDFPDTNATLGQATVLKNGGFFVVYESVDPSSSVGGYTDVVRQVDGSGQISAPSATIGPFNDFNQVDTQKTLLANGGFALLTTNNQPFVAADESLTDVSLLIGTPDGRLTNFVVSHFETDGGTPLPMLVQTHPTIGIGPNDTVIVTYDRYYTPPNPDFPTDDPTGEQHFQQSYDDTGHLVSQRFQDFDGTVKTTSYDPSGAVATEYTRHPDGAFDTAAYGIVGKGYVDQEASYDASGHLISMVRHYADGALALKETATSTENWGTDGSHVVRHADGATNYVDSYDPSGNLVSEDIRDTANNTHVRDIYSPGNGNVFEEQFFYADGSKEISEYGPSGSVKTVDTDASGFVTALTRRDGSGAVFMETHDHGGHYTENSYDMFGRPLVSIVGDDQNKTVVSTTWDGLNDTPPLQMIEHWSGGAVTDREFIDATSDRITIYGAGVRKDVGENAVVVGSPLGSNSFSFGESVGKATLSGFIAGEAANHDVIDLHMSGIAGFGDLQSHLSASGTGTLITLTAQDTILLKGVAPTMLTSSDFSFH